MSDERNEDEILGRALARAIETQDARETPYERSRLAVHPLRRGVAIWQFVGATAAALVVVLAFGAWLMRPNDTLPVAASATPTPRASSSPAVTSGPQSAVPQYSPVWAYFTRDGLPPIGAMVNAHVGVVPTSADARIGQRLMALAMDVRQSDVPAGTIDPLATVAGTTTGSGGGIGIAVQVSGDLATLDFHLASGWGIHGTSVAQQLVQQIVYTATEEVGIRRILITESGHAAKIDQLVVDKPLTRDDVSGYTVRADDSLSWGGDDSIPHVMPFITSREIEDGSLVRLTLEGRAQDGAKANLPSFTIHLAPNDGFPKTRDDGYPPKELMTIAFQWNGGGTSGGAAGVEKVDRSPLRLFVANGPSIVLGLDDARPWRAYEPDKQHLVVEIGGDPRLVSDRIAVTGQNVTPGATVPRTFTISGAARTFEANVVWHVIDANKKGVIASGQTTATLGSSELWGTFSTQVALPATASGNVTLEVYEVSMKDGSQQGVVSIPIVVR